MRPIEQVLMGLSARNFQDPGSVQAAQASIERIRHLLWHGPPDKADQEIVLLLGHSGKIAERSGMSVHESTNNLTRLCKDLQGYAQNNRDAITNYHRRQHGKNRSRAHVRRALSTRLPTRMGKKQRMRGHPEAPIASRWSERRSWMGASNRGVSFRWRHSQTSIFPLPNVRPRR